MLNKNNTNIFFILLMVFLAITVWGHARVLLEILAKKRGVREVHGLGNLFDTVACIS